MNQGAVARTSRALDLIPYVVSHPGISIEELAQDFATTEAEISEVLNIVFMCGLPGYTHLELIDLSTEGGSVSIIDPQNLDKPRTLSQVEIVSVLLGLQNLRSQGVSPEIEETIESLESKLKSLLKDMNSLLLIDNQHAIVSSEWTDLISSSIRSRMVMELEYVSLTSEEFTSRTIAPLRIYARLGYFYLEAISLDVEQVRNFRLDRIKDLKVSAIPYPEGIVKDSVGAAGDLDSQNAISVEVLIPSTARLFLERNEGIITSTVQFGEMLKVNLEVTSTDWLLRALGALDGRVEVISPPRLASDFQAHAFSTLTNYKIEA